MSANAPQNANTADVQAIYAQFGQSSSSTADSQQGLIYFNADTFR